MATKVSTGYGDIHIIRVISQNGQPGQLEVSVGRPQEDDEQLDGWWWGELDGREGAFPSLVVEECDEEGEPLEEELTPESLSPVASPPPTAPPVGPPLSPPLSLTATDTPDTPTSSAPPASLPPTLPPVAPGLPPASVPPVAPPLLVESPADELNLDDDAAPEPAPATSTPKFDVNLANGKPVGVSSGKVHVEKKMVEKDHQDDSSAKSARTVARQANAQSLGLPAARIVITAATPVCEDKAAGWAEKSETDAEAEGEAEADADADAEAEDDEDEEAEEDSVVEAVAAGADVGVGTGAGGGGGAEDVPDDLEPRRLARLAGLGESDA